MLEIVKRIWVVILCGVLVKVGAATTRRHEEMVKLTNLAGLSGTDEITTDADPDDQPFETILENTEIALMTKERNMKILEKDIPREFNVKDAWPNCRRIDQPNDQGKCRSDWALAAASVLTDRLCIYFWTLFDEPVSAYHVLTCNGDDGCNSGSAATAWRFFEREGVVTGGQYHSQIGCLPYQIEPCDHRPTSKDACSFSTTVDTPACPNKCIDDRFDFKHRLYVNRSYAIENNVSEIQKEILTNGPVQASMMVYDDFLYYTGLDEGVYYHYVGQLLGGMSIKIIGWGTTSATGTDYWLVVNSWGTTWGTKGTFKIRRGTNECGVESNVVAGDPSMNHNPSFIVTK